MGVLRFKYDVKAAVNQFNNNPKMLRLFGRFYDTSYGIRSKILLSTLQFSTFQTLDTSELFISDKIVDNFKEFKSRVKAMAIHLERNGLDASNRVNWPSIFLERAELLHTTNNQPLDISTLLQ